MRHELLITDYESATCHRWCLLVSGLIVPGSEPHVVHGEIRCPGYGPSVKDVRIDEIYEVADFGVVPDQGFRLNFIEVDDGEEKMIAELMRSDVDVVSIGSKILEDWIERQGPGKARE